MDDKSIFVRTSKGDNELQRKVSHLPGDLKRALLMVDGSSTVGEIRKRAAPSMRPGLGEMLQELEKSDFIQENPSISIISKAAVPPKKAAPPNMVVPTKISTPPRNQPIDGGRELDFMAGYTASPTGVPTAKDVSSEKSRARAEKESRLEIEAEKLKAHREAEAILLKAVQEAARLQEETARRAKEEVENTRLKIEQEAKKVREELEAARLKVEHETKLRLDAIAREQKEAEVALFKAEQEAKKVRDELEAARLKAEQENRLRREVAVREQQLAEAARLKAEQEAKKLRDELEAARLKAEQESRLRREAAVREQQQAEAARAKAEQEAKKVRDELEAVRLQAEEENRLRQEAAAREKQQAEAARAKAEQEAKKVRDELEAVRLKAEEENRLRQEAEAWEQQQAEAMRVHIELEAKTLRAEQAAKAQEEAAKAREAELLAKEERGEAGLQAGLPRVAAATEVKSDIFSFGSFEIDESRQSTSLLQNDQPPAQEFTTEQEVSVTESTTQFENTHQDSPASKEGVTAVVREPVEREAGREQINREEQDRLTVEQRVSAEAQAKVLADAQSRVWAEAEQRALEIAKANAERAAYQAEYPVTGAGHMNKPVATRAQRKAFAWGRLAGYMIYLGLFLLLLLIGALFVVPYVLPMRDYMPKVQQLLSIRLNQPVHIGNLSARILPTPRIELGEIFIGEVKQLQVGEAQINFDILGLFGDQKPISSVEFQNVKVSGAGLLKTVAWLQQMANHDQYPVSRMVIRQGTLDADAFQLISVEGEVEFNPVGKFTKANFRANSGKYTFGINTTPIDKLQVAITVRDSTLPLLPNWTFDELNAKGELGKDELQVSEFDAHILGGTLQGDANINWRSGWHAQGTLSALSIDMKSLSKLLDGKAEGSARFKLNSMDLESLTDSAVLDGNFKASDGMISGMDIVETARMRSRENLPGGRTHFDALSGTILYANNVYHFKQVKVSAGVLNATASFDVAKQQLTGKMNVSLSMHDGTTPVDLQIGGAVDNPTLRFTH